MKLLYSILFSLLGVVSNAQVFRGEIFIRDQSNWYLNQIYVTNINEHKTVLASFDGSFTINAKAGDVVRFTSIATERKDIKVTEKMFSQPHYYVELQIAYKEIQEVIISRFKPTGNLRTDVLSLNTKNKAQEIKKMIGLPAPKGDGTSPQLPVASLSGGGLTFSIDSFYDLLSGDKKRKQRLNAYEKMNGAVSQIKNYYGKDYFNQLKIPENMVDNFLQFVYSSDQIQMYIDMKNFDAVGFYIEKYLPIYQKRLRNTQLMDVISTTKKL